MSKVSRTSIWRKFPEWMLKEIVIFRKEETMRERFASGIPIYIDESTYETLGTFEIVNKKNLERFCKWGNCHKYTLRSNANGEKCYIVTRDKY